VTVETRFWVDERTAEPAAVTTEVIAAARQAFTPAKSDAQSTPQA
jgi:hypothetical protein